MDRTADKNKTGQPGLAMKEVWNPNNTRFNDGIEEVEAKFGSKAPKRSPYYEKLMKRHGKKDRCICIDCGKGFKNESTLPKMNPRCAQCREKIRIEYQLAKA